MPIDKINDSMKYQNPSSILLTKKFTDLHSIFTNFMNLVTDYASGSYTVKNILYNTDVLMDVFIHADKKTERSGFFHKSGKSNEYKTIAALCYWIIKLHPYYIVAEKQLDANINMDFSAINEAFALYLYERIVKKVHEEKGENIVFNKKYIKELKYTLRYQHFHKATLVFLFKPKYKNLKQKYLQFHNKKIS